MSFCDWLISLSIISSRFIHVAAGVKISSLCMYIPHFLYPFICQWTLGLLLLVFECLEDQGWVSWQSLAHSRYYQSFRVVKIFSWNLSTEGERGHYHPEEEAREIQGKKWVRAAFQLVPLPPLSPPIPPPHGSECKDHHVNPLSDLQWLPDVLGIQFKLLMMVHKSLMPASSNLHSHLLALATPAKFNFF